MGSDTSAVDPSSLYSSPQMRAIRPLRWMRTICIFCIKNRWNLANALERLALEYGCNRLTVQCGGTVNSLLLREKLIDYVDIVVAPVLVGGKDTSTLIDGRSLQSQRELNQLGGAETD